MSNLSTYISNFSTYQLVMSSSAGQFSNLSQILKFIYQGKLLLAKNSHIIDGKVYLSEEERLKDFDSWYTAEVHSPKLVDEAITETVKLITGPDVSESCKSKIVCAAPRDISLLSYIQDFNKYFEADGSCFVVVFMRLVDAILFQAKIVSHGDHRLIKGITLFMTFSRREEKFMEQYPDPINNEQIKFLIYSWKIIQNVYDVELECLNIRMLPGTVIKFNQSYQHPKTSNF